MRKIWIHQGCKVKSQQLADLKKKIKEKLKSQFLF
jgi:hypothetical protein